MKERRAVNEKKGKRHLFEKLTCIWTDMLVFIACSSVKYI